MRTIQSLMFLVLVSASCTLRINKNNIPTPPFAPLPNDADTTATSVPFTTPNNGYIVFDVVKESDTYIASLPTICLRNYQDCSRSIIYSPDVYQKEMASPLSWESKGRQFVVTTNLSGNQDLTIGTFADGILERFTIETPNWEDCPIWSPNGQTILFAKEIQDKSEYLSELWVINRNGSNPRYLTKGSCGSWSPDGQRIIYSIYSGDKTISQRIYAIDVSDTTLEEPSYLTTNLDYIGKAIYSPDGKKIAFEGVKDERWSIYLINADGSEFLELTPTLPDATSPIWSPNGLNIAFITHSSHLEPGEIFLIDTNGTNLINISKSPAWDDGHPSWSPDSSMMVFMSQREAGFFNIYVVNADGTGLRKITEANSAIEFMYPSWIP